MLKNPEFIEEILKINEQLKKAEASEDETFEEMKEGEEFGAEEEEAGAGFGDMLKSVWNYFKAKIKSTWNYFTESRMVRGLTHFVKSMYDRIVEFCGGDGTSKPNWGRITILTAAVAVLGVFAIVFGGGGSAVGKFTAL